MPRMLKETRRRVIAALYGLLLLAFTLQSTGCTIAGLGIGALVDSSKPDREEVPPSEWNQLEPGQEVLVVRGDTTRAEKLRLVGVTERSNDLTGFAAADGIDSYSATLFFIRNDWRTYSSNRRPVRGTLSVDTLVVPAYEITAMYRPLNHSGILVGALIGLLIDVAVVASIAAAFSGWGEGWGSN